MTMTEVIDDTIFWLSQKLRPAGRFDSAFGLAKTRAQRSTNGISSILIAWVKLSLNGSLRALLRNFCTADAALRS